MMSGDCVTTSQFSCPATVFTLGDKLLFCFVLFDLLFEEIAVLCYESQQWQIFPVLVISKMFSHFWHCHTLVFKLTTFGKLGLQLLICELEIFHFGAPNLQ